MSLTVERWELPSLPVTGTTDRFPVRHIYCIGRNYAEHAREMGQDPEREPPFFFCKQADAVLAEGGDLPYPPGTQNFQHEIELVVAIHKRTERVGAGEALGCVFGYAVGLDMTRRDLQQRAKEKGHPWDFGKSFAHAAPIGPVHPVTQVGHVAAGEIRLQVNGEVRQRGRLEDMIWSVPEAIAFLSEYYTLLPGDLIMTGTPAGVAAVVPGDRLVGGIEALGELRVTITPPREQARTH